MACKWIPGLASLNPFETDLRGTRRRGHAASSHCLNRDSQGGEEMRVKMGNGETEMTSFTYVIGPVLLLRNFVGSGRGWIWLFCDAGEREVGVQLMSEI